MTEIIVGVFSAAIGFVSGLLTPWVRWHVDKRREQLAYRRDLIKSWRAAIEAEQFELTDSRSTFGSSATYSSLRAQLSQEVLEKIEAPRTLYAGGGRGDFVRRQMLLDEVARLEKEWGFV